MAPIKIYKKVNTYKKKKILSIVSYVSLTIGLGFVMWAVYPMISFELYAFFFLKRKPSSPIPQSETVSALEYAKSVYASSGIFSSNLKDFSDANVWFPRGNNFPVKQDIDIKNYSLSIPKLNLTNLYVDVGGEDLSKSLIHYLPASAPGQYGNVSIFGHSSLPQLYKKNDYNTVFTFLPKITLGDKVVIDSGGVSYEYEVYDIYIVKPQEVSVLEQKFDNSYLTLVTCVPPGTYKDRLIVKAKLTTN